MINLSEKDFQKVVEITNKIDLNISNLINEQMSGAYQSKRELVHLTAIVSSLSYYLGKTLVKLASYSYNKDIHPLLVASGKIVNEGITDSTNESSNSGLLN